MQPDLFRQINNNLLDLQQSDLQSYPAQIRRLGRLLRHEELTIPTKELVKGVDLGEFIASSEKTQSSMIGSAELLWPDDDIKILGLKLLLLQRFGETPDYVAEFGHQFYYTRSNKIMADVQAVIAQLIIPFVRDFKEYVDRAGVIHPRLVPALSQKVFIVHGHDIEARETVARFVSQLGMEPIILNEQASLGRTIVEKVEAYSDVGFAIVLLTPDDEGRATGEKELEQRARQNVLLELGYFMALLGRDRVCALRRGNVSIPSDFAGVVWEELDKDGGWRLKLARELKAAGASIDLTLIVG